MFESQLVSKLCCFELLAVLYGRLEKTDLNSVESRITKAYCSEVKTGKELTMAITKYENCSKYFFLYYGMLVGAVIDPMWLSLL